MKTKVPVPFCRSLPSLFGLIVMSACAASAAPNPAAHDRNWPAWRGPAGNGVVLHGDPPLEWSEQKNIQWKIAVPGRGHSTPVIWDKKIFLLTVTSADAAPAAQWRPGASVFAQAQAQQPPRRGRGGGRGPGGDRPTVDHTFTTLCIDRDTGKVVWEKVARREVPHLGIHRDNSYSSGSPVTDGERLYVSFGSHGLYCYDLDGNQVWSKDLGKVSVTFGEGSSPALSGDTLVVVQDNNDQSFVYALDKRTGRELWKAEREEGSGWTTPYIVKAGGRTQVIISGSHAVRSYNIENGEVIWQCSGLGSNPVPTVVGNPGVVYAMSGHHAPNAVLAIRTDRTGDLTGTDGLLWKYERGTPYVPSPLLVDDLLYFCQKNEAILTCLDATTGQPHFAQHRLASIVGVYASPIVVEDRIYLAGRNGVTVVLQKSKEVKILASNQLDEAFDASPAVVGKDLFLRGRGHLYRIAANP